MNRSRIFILIGSILVVGAAAVYLRGLKNASETSGPDQSQLSIVDNELNDHVRQALRQRAELDETVWQRELTAQRYEQFFVRLWDSLRSSEEAWRELATVPLQTVVVGKPSAATQIAHGIELLDMAAGPTLTAAEWSDFVSRFHADGYRLAQSEWHHLRFEHTRDGPHSTVSVVLHVINDERVERVVVKGEVGIDWNSDAKTPIPAKIDATGLHIQRRAGQPPFRLAATLPATQMGATDFVGAYDFDGDGLSEIVFGNRLFQNRGGGNFSAQRLCRHRVAPLQSAVIADFNGDGRVDLLCADPHARPQLFLADASGRYSGPPIEVPSIEPIREFSTSITAGDVNADGYLDVWLTQYKRPYADGQMPTPYYDANDGHNAYLLINDGQGNFTDRTAASGLAEKRKRRTYSSSLVDLDGDGDLDLVVVSDFAGLDLYQNDGTGTFRDVTKEIVDQPHNFGMSHAIADFDGDSQLDLFVCGMGSTTARRLDAMHAGPKGRPNETRMRTVMGYGNRMYLATDGRFVEPPFRRQVARTGWSWGVAELDFDNDGDRDIYVGNGHISGPSVADYCSVFWRHDIYAGTSQPDPVLERLFLDTQQEFQSRGSWNGYEHNCLLMNQAGKGFVETAFLLGLAHEFDTRNIVADDIDANGLVDLLIVQRPLGQPATLQVWKNYCQDVGNWIGVVITDQAGVLTPGTMVVAHTDMGDRVATVVNGDSFNSQHAATLHFGIGKLDRVDRIKVTRPNGAIHLITDPTIGEYHMIPAVMPD